MDGFFVAKFKKFSNTIPKPVKEGDSTEEVSADATTTPISTGPSAGQQATQKSKAQGNHASKEVAPAPGKAAKQPHRSLKKKNKPFQKHPSAPQKPGKPANKSQSGVGKPRNKSPAGKMDRRKFKKFKKNK